MAGYPGYVVAITPIEFESYWLKPIPRNTHMKPTCIPIRPWFLLTTLSLSTLALLETDGIGNGGCNNGNGNTIEIHVETPGHSSPYEARGGDVLIRRVVWADDREFEDFIFASNVTEVEYEGGVNKLRTITGHEGSVGTPGVFPIQDEDGDGNTISETDRQLFADRILGAWNHDNINSYIHRRSKEHFSCIVEYEETIRDNSPLEDEIGELIVFEVSGNSWLQIEAIDESGAVMGTPIVVGNYKKVHPERLYTRKYADNGSPLSGSYEIRALGIDLSDLGVNEVRFLRFSKPQHPGGGGDIKASVRVVGVRTSTVPTAAMVFD